MYFTTNFNDLNKLIITISLIKLIYVWGGQDWAKSEIDDVHAVRAKRLLGLEPSPARPLAGSLGCSLSEIVKSLKGR